MGAAGTYSAVKASKKALEDAIKVVFAAPKANPNLTADQQAVALADAIVTWLASCPVVVRVLPADAALQTTTSPICGNSLLGIFKSLLKKTKV